MDNNKIIPLKKNRNVILLHPSNSREQMELLNIDDSIEISNAFNPKFKELGYRFSHWNFKEPKLNREEEEKNKELFLQKLGNLFCKTKVFKDFDQKEIVGWGDLFQSIEIELFKVLNSERYTVLYSFYDLDKDPNGSIIKEEFDELTEEEIINTQYEYYCKSPTIIHFTVKESFILYFLSKEKVESIFQELTNLISYLLGESIHYTFYSIIEKNRFSSLIYGFSSIESWIDKTKNQAKWNYDNCPKIKHKNLTFRSKPEVLIFDELQKRDVLFFPMPVSVLSNEDKFYPEPDFLICSKGRFGILEIHGKAYHTSDTAAKESKRARLFKRFMKFMMQLNV
jgi:hypothetical protein